MPEPYAVRMGANGSKQYYKTKRDYEAGKLSSFGRTNQRLRRSGAI
ncbi:hypothetical protein ACQ1PF_09535 [Ornithobacterium rhinotracheale]